MNLLDTKIGDGNCTVLLKNVFIVSDTNLKKILLNTHSFDDLKHMEILNTIKTRSLLIIDEFDTIYDPMKSKFNLPIGTKTPLAEGKLITAEMYTTFIKFIHYTLIRKNNGSEKYTCKKLSKKELLVYLSDYINNMTADKTKHIKQTLLTLYNFMMHKHETISHIDQKSFYEIKTFEKLFNTLIDIGSLLYNHRYGFPTEKSHKESQFYAVPYSSADTPSFESNFTDIDIVITTTILAYFYCDKFRVIDTKKIINYYKDELIYNLKQTGCSNQEIYDKLCYEAFFEVFDCSVAQFECMSIHDDEIMEIITKKINSNPVRHNLMEIHIEKVIGELGYSTSYKSCNAIDIISSTFALYKCGFTGMVFLNLPYYPIGNTCEFTKIQKNDSDIGSVYFAILGGSGKGTGNKFFNLSHNVSQEELLVKIIDELGDEYNALIDSGAFLLNSPIEKVAAQLLLKYPDKKIIYINKSNDKKILSKKDGVVEYNDEQYETHEVFMYYDNSHIIGQDIKQPFRFKALVTVNVFNKLSDITQACFRLRNLNYGHEIDFMINSNMTNVSTRESLLEMLYKKEKNIVDGVTELEKLKQNSMYIKNCAAKASDKYMMPIYSEYNEYMKYRTTKEFFDISDLQMDFHEEYIKKTYAFR